MKLEPEAMHHRVTFSPDIGCNTKDAVILEQVATNIRRPLPQAKPHPPNGDTIALVCGGPSLNMTEDELHEAAWNGAKVCALNGAYQWCIDHRIRPSAMVMLDAREFNARFVETPVPGCRYLLAAQCHPRAFELCVGRDVTIWHACSAAQPELDLLNEYYFKKVFPVTLGTTVAMRAITLMRMLGFYSFDVFGLDSCILDGQHHAYAQRENDADVQFDVVLHPRDRERASETFRVTPWMAKQAYDIQQLIKERGNTFRLNVRGPGLIASLMRTGAELAQP